MRICRRLLPTLTVRGWLGVLLVVPAVLAPAGPSQHASASAAVHAGRSELTWTGCGSGFECSTLDVPLDYAARDPAARTVRLAVIRKPARVPSARIGALLVNPGGPGASAIDFARSFAATTAAAIRDRFDIVAFDPRGVGQSSPVVCHARLLDIFGADPDPDSEAEWAMLEAGARQMAGECAAGHGDLLPHLGTESVARDMDEVRRALGEEQITYVGFSYGTAIGATYADLFPGHVRAMVLDGAFQFYDIPGAEGLRLQSIGFERALESYLAFCRASRCALTLGDGDVEAALDDLLARIDRAPLPAPTANRPAGIGEATLGLAAALYSESLWGTLSAALALAAAGDGSGFVRLADMYLDRHPDGTYSNGYEMYVAVSCLDYSWPRSEAEFRALAERHRRSAPHFGVFNLLTSALPCASWAAGSHPLPAPVAAGSPDIVVIATTNDPATPYEQGVAVSRQLQNGLLLTFVGEGHTVFGHGNACIDRTVESYLVSLRVFASGSRCVAGLASLLPPLQRRAVIPGLNRE